MILTYFQRNISCHVILKLLLIYSIFIKVMLETSVDDMTPAKLRSKSDAKMSQGDLSGALELLDQV